MRRQKLAGRTVKEAEQGEGELDAQGNSTAGAEKELQTLFVKDNLVQFNFSKDLLNPPKAWLVAGGAKLCVGRWVDESLNKKIL